jgi:hypothetical protein
MAFYFEASLLRNNGTKAFWLKVRVPVQLVSVLLLLARLA